MTDHSASPYIAVDGGGSHSRFAFWDGARRWTTEAGGANVSSDFEAAIQELEVGLKSLSQQSGQAVEALAQVPTFLGLAGMISDDIRTHVARALPFAHVQIEDDRPAALKGALGEEDGALCHCGTGSFFALQTSGTRRIVGGWGPILGDEASAYFVGKSAVQRTLSVVDGMASPSPLTEYVTSEIGGAVNIIALAGRVSQTEIAAVAPLVTEYASQGDPHAREIMKASTKHIEDTLRQLGWSSPLPVCLTGGLGPEFAPYLSEAIRAATASPKGTPLDGAVSLARTFAETVRE